MTAVSGVFVLWLEAAGLRSDYPSAKQQVPFPEKICVPKRLIPKCINTAKVDMQLWPLASETDGQVDSMGDGMGGFQQFFFKGFAKDNFSEFFIQVAGYMFDEDTPHTPTTGRMGPALNKNTQMLVRYPRSRPWCCFIATAAAYLPGLYLAFVPHPPCDGSRLRLQPDTNPALYSSTSTRPARRIGRSSRKRASTVLDVVVSSALTEEWKSAVLPFAPSEWYRCSSPAESLRRGDWFKLICGASFEV